MTTEPRRAALALRPRNLPEEAEFQPGGQEWVWCERAASGELHGALRVYREDGAPLLEASYVRGKRHGSFRRFHRSGALAEEGRYFDDLRDGFWTSFADGESVDSIRDCCIPEATRVLQQEYRRGTLLAEAFFSAAGQALFEAEPATATWPEPLREREDDLLSLGYGFWPALEPLPSKTSEGDEACLEQPLAALQDAVRRAALRVEQYRAALLRLASEQAPPDVSALLGPEPPALRQQVIIPEGDEEVVQIDERPAIAAASEKQLALDARVAWSGLCWLCWAAGLDQVGLPTVWRSRPELHRALLSASERCELLRHYAPPLDDAPHFHGLDESRLPASALARLARHYEEARAMLLFVSDPECLSPWQSDLGRALEA